MFIRDCSACSCCLFFFFTHPATTTIYTLSLHDALPILLRHPRIVDEQGGHVPPQDGVDGRRGTEKWHVDHVEVCRPLELQTRSEEHTSELQSLRHLVCRLLLEKKNKQRVKMTNAKNTQR